MNINDFKSYCDDKTLKCGYHHFDDGAVEICMNLYNNKIYTMVFDKEQYFVEITLCNTEITGWSCDCLLNKESLCRHVVAALYKIKAEL